jgi:hypothetical protein
MLIEYGNHEYQNRKSHVEEEAPIAVRSTSIQSPRSSALHQQGDQPFSTFDLTAMIMLSVVLLPTIGGIIWAYRRKSRQPAFHAQPPDVLPCQRCRYFYPNPYLKCAIHPIAAMTEASSDCSDYWPDHEDTLVGK